METGLTRGVLAGWLLLAVAGAGSVEAQLPASPGLRWGSGYLDVPTAVILPGSGLRTAFSGFWSSVPSSPLVDETGAVTGEGPGVERFHGDLALSLGLLDRVELGLSLQSFQDDEEGGALWGAFGTLVLLRPDPGGLGIAVGARVLNRPGLPEGVEGAPSRLGFNDPRLRRRYEGGEEVSTRFSPWAAGTLALPGPRRAGLPESDVTLTFGWGGGTFREGASLDWYAEGGSNGWFVGGSWGFTLAPDATLGLEAEYAGFDVNLGAEVNWRGVRLGLHALGVNHGDPVSVYRSRRWGFSVGLEACPLLRRACRARVRRAPADTVRLPAPPPDTVRLPAPPRDTLGLGGPTPESARRSGRVRWLEAGGDVDDLLEYPIQGIEDGDGRAAGEVGLLLHGLGPQESIVPAQGLCPHRGDDHPGVERAHCLDADEFGFDGVAHHGVDRGERGVGTHAEVSLPGGDARGLSGQRRPTPFHAHRHGPVAVGGRAELKVQKAEPTPRGLVHLGHAGISVILAECEELHGEGNLAGMLRISGAFATPSPRSIPAPDGTS